MIKTAQPALHGVQHLPDGSDPIPGLFTSAGADVLDLILALGPDAFWKLNESTGDIAHDSSGNSHDLTRELTGPDTYTAPTWAQPAGPPGEQTAHFGSTAGGALGTRVSSTGMSAFTNNFTAGIWVNIHSAAASTGEILGQGYPYHASNGWGLLTVSSKFNVMANGVPCAANSTFSVDTWYFVATVRDAGTWKLYINGLLQATSIGTSPGSGYAGNTWLGSDAYVGGGAGTHGTYLQDGDLSYGFIVNSVVSGTDLLAIYEAGSAGGLLGAGLVWTSDGSGGASWQPSTIEVDY